MSKNFNAFDLLVMAERRYGEPEFMLTRNLWYDTFDKLKIDKMREQVNPNVHELEQFLNANEAYEEAHKLRGLKLKYQAMTTEPTTIEKTMTPYQLYQANNPLWAAELSALGIESFLDLEDSAEYHFRDVEATMGHNSDSSDGVYIELKGGIYKLSKEMFENTYEYAMKQSGLKTVDWASYYPKSMINLAKGKK